MTEGRPLVITEIAASVGCSATYLHRCTEFMTFVKLNRGSVPKGRKDGQTGDIETTWTDRDCRTDDEADDWSGD